MYGWREFVDSIVKHYSTLEITRRELAKLLNVLTVYGGDAVNGFGCYFISAPGEEHILLCARGEFLKWRASDGVLYFRVQVNRDDQSARFVRVSLTPDVRRDDGSVAEISPELQSKLVSALQLVFPHFRAEFTLPVPEELVEAAGS